MGSEIERVTVVKGEDYVMPTPDGLPVVDSKIEKRLKKIEDTLGIQP